MQVFLPFPCITESLQVLDKKRLGKQRVEAKQLLDVVLNDQKGWKNHPCARMYSQYPGFLIEYYNQSLVEFQNKGGKNNVLKRMISMDLVYPPWFGDDKFHSSHRSNLLRKAQWDEIGVGTDFKKKKKSGELLENLEKFGITKNNTPANLEYVWPI